MVRSSTKTHKGGRALRLEPSYHEVYEALPEIGKIFADAGWLEFCRKLKMFHALIAMAFTESFNGYRDRFGGLTMLVSESSIDEVFKIENEGER